jgi:hypothetical protein
MTGKVEVTPFFERAQASDDYVAGVRATSGAPVGVEITLPAELVDRAVLVRAHLSIDLTPDGRLFLDSDDVDDETLEAASAAGGVSGQTLESLITACLDPELLAGETDPLRELTQLRAQLDRALAALDATLARMKAQN